MSAKHFGATLLATRIVVGGAAMALAMALPAATAQAEPTDDAQSQQVDEAFLAALKDRNVKLPPGVSAVDLAHSTCDVLTRTGSVDNALRHIKNATDWSDLKKITSFGTLAVQGYCPTSMPKQ